MDIREAHRIQRNFEGMDDPSEEDIFLYTEAMDYLIRETADPKVMLSLGGYYYEQKIFPLALKYYEMAADYKMPNAWEGLGYIWYYGRTGKRDFEKAFHYYSLAKEAGITEAAVKVADMYKNGYYVEQNFEKYREIIEELYPKVIRARYLNEPVPEVCTRLAMIRKEEGNINEAVRLLYQAKDFQAQRLKYSNFFGGINIMKWLIDDLYELTRFDDEDFDLFDCMWLLDGQESVTIRFYYGDAPQTIKAVVENGEPAIHWGEEVYPDRDAFYARAMLDGQRLMSLQDDLYGFEIVREE